MGNYLIICGGTGLFPFLDLLDFLLKNAYIWLLCRKKGRSMQNKILIFKVLV